MASAQEFSSPGEHMASLSGGSDNVSYGPPVYYSNSGSSSNVIYAPSSMNSSGMRRLDEDYGSSAYSRSNRYNREYMNYNNELFNSAKDYDMYMSNTAIQRQVEDLKKAGLNPILATRLGGATYHGVQAPYLSISPSSALNSYLNYGSSMYNTDVNANTSIETTKMQNDSREFISQFQVCSELLQQGRLFDHENELVELKKNADRFLDSMQALDNQQLKKLGFQNDKDLKDFQFQLDKDWFNFKNFGNTNPGKVGPSIVRLVDKVAHLIPFASGVLS